MKIRSDPLCRLCEQKKNGSTDHLVSSCRILTPKEYKERHDEIGHYIYWKICKDYGILESEKLCKHQPELITERKELLFSRTLLVKMWLFKTTSNASNSGSTGYDQEKER